MNWIDGPSLGRRAARKAARRAEIIEIASRHFLERGYGRTSLSAVAAEMGGSKETLWRYFSSKTELFAAVIETATSASRLEVGRVLDPVHPVDMVVKDFVRAFVARMTQPDAIALQRLIIGEAGQFPEIGQTFFEREVVRSRTVLSDYLAVQMEAGKLRSADHAQAADMLMALCAGGQAKRMLWGVEGQQELTVDREACEITDWFLRSYAPK